jgi:hypothetical protein
MKAVVAALIAAALAFGFGCARPDWVQETLVTVDVTGVWVGSMGRGGRVTTEVRLELEQQGPKVKGYLRPLLGHSFFDGPVDGTVSGDVFTFRQPKGNLVAEMTVSGDEMTGHVSVGTSAPIFLRRVDSSAPPRPQQP